MDRLGRPDHITDVLIHMHLSNWFTFEGNRPYTYESLIINDDSIEKPTKEFLESELLKIQNEWDAQEYSRNRASAYDSVGDQLDQLMKDMRDGTTTHKDACEAVKAKYPKPE